MENSKLHILGPGVPSEDASLSVLPIIVDHRPQNVSAWNMTLTLLLLHEAAVCILCTLGVLYTVYYSLAGGFLS